MAVQQELFSWSSDESCKVEFISRHRGGHILDRIIDKPTREGDSMNRSINQRPPSETDDGVAETVRKRAMINLRGLGGALFGDNFDHSKRESY